MSKTYQNVHVLLPKDDLQTLKRYSRADKKSVGELIRLAVRKVYGITEPAKRQEAFRRLSEQNELEMEDWEKVKKDLLRRYG